MNQNTQHISYEMDEKAYDFMKFQRKYYTDKADDSALMEQTTQPFWQSMRLSKRRLASKGLSMDVEILHDPKSKTVKNEQVQIKKDGYHLAGNKALNVISRRQFYKNGKRISAIKNREICNLSLLKAEVDGEDAACPNCGYVNTVTSFVDGCDACESKFTVQDFEAKIAGFSLEENTSAKIKENVFANAKTLGWIFVGLIILAIITFILSYMRLIGGNTDINIAGAAVGFVLTLVMIPITAKSLIALLALFVIGTFFLLLIYKKNILRETIVKEQFPNFSARDFYQNLEYKLRNIHLTDNVDEVSVFARCALDNYVKNYCNVVECDMTRLKFLKCKKDTEGYRVKVEAELRLTECKRKRIFTNYEKLRLDLFGKPEVIDKSATILREYKCPGCGSSLNVLEGGKCSYCGKIFDYSEFGWVIETYQGKRKVVSLYQFIKFAMLSCFILVFGVNILFPIGFSQGNIFKLYQNLSEQAVQIENIYTELERPDALYEGVALLSAEDFLIECRYEYQTTDAVLIMKEYRSFLEKQGFVLSSETENSYTLCRIFDFKISEYSERACYRVVVTRDDSNIIIEEFMDTALEE